MFNEKQHAFQIKGRSCGLVGFWRRAEHAQYRLRERIYVVQVDSKPGGKRCTVFSTASWLEGPFSGSLNGQIAPLLGMSPRIPKLFNLYKITDGIPRDNFC